MLPSPGYLLFSLALALEGLVVLILVMPMPSNNARGIIVDLLLKAWNKQAVRYSYWGAVAVCGLYFYDAASTIASAPVWMYSCEQREMLFFVERNAYTTGMFVFLFFVLRRLLDIQQQLFTIRKQMKAQAGVKKAD